MTSAEEPTGLPGKDAAPGRSVPRPPGGPVHPPPARPGQPGGATAPGPGRAGRNLPHAIVIGLALGGIALVTLFTVKATFLLYVGGLVTLGYTELRHVLGTRGIRLPVIPIAAGGAAMLALSYFSGALAALAALAVTVVVLLGWRLPGGADGYVRDVTASVFAVAYLPLMTVFVGLMLARPDGARRTVIFLVLTVCSDIGGYAAGVLFGRHPMAPAISPKKTWEGLAGSAAACLAAGAIMVPGLLHGRVWQGLILGAAATAAAALGDLAESMIKRDLAVKDMGSVLPGHGGILDRLDSLLIVAPVSWLLLAVFIQHPGH